MGVFLFLFFLSTYINNLPAVPVKVGYLGENHKEKKGRFKKKKSFTSSNFDVGEPEKNVTRN